MEPTQIRRFFTQEKFKDIFSLTRISGHTTLAVPREGYPFSAHSSTGNDIAWKIGKSVKKLLYPRCSASEDDMYWAAELKDYANIYTVINAMGGLDAVQDHIFNYQDVEQVVEREMLSKRKSLTNTIATMCNVFFVRGKTGQLCMLLVEYEAGQCFVKTSRILIKPWFGGIFSETLPYGAQVFFKGDATQHLESIHELLYLKYDIHFKQDDRKENYYTFCRPITEDSFRQREIPFMFEAIRRFYEERNHRCVIVPNKEMVVYNMVNGKEEEVLRLTLRQIPPKPHETFTSLMIGVSFIIIKN